MRHTICIIMWRDHVLRIKRTPEGTWLLLVSHFTYAVTPYKMRVKYHADFMNPLTANESVALNRSRLQCGPKSGLPAHDHHLNRFKKKFSGKLLGKFVVKQIWKIPPHLAYVATLPSETLMSAKQAINDKLQGSVVSCTLRAWPTHC